MPDSENGPEQELGPKFADAFQTKADGVRALQARGMANEARRRVRKRRHNLIAAAAAVLVLGGIGGVWTAVGGPSPVATSADNSSAGAGSGEEKAQAPQTDGTSCADRDPGISVQNYTQPLAVRGLDLESPVYGLQACRYRLVNGGTALLGSRFFDAAAAQQIVDSIKVLPERNPALPVFKCAPEQARPQELIVLLFDTAQGQREVWVQYDGCADAGFFTGTRTYGLYAAPLKLFMIGNLRPAGGTYLDHLSGW
jgi:hypothetical protein